MDEGARRNNQATKTARLLRRQVRWGLRLKSQADKPRGAKSDDAAKTAFDEARKSVEDAAAISGGLWLSYLFVLLYIGIAAGGVTHKDLLLENAVKLPFLNVELPLVAFFSLAPILFIIVHAYTLMHFVMLAAKARAYDEALHAVFGEGADMAEDRNAQRRRLPSNIFVQFLAGPKDIREGGLGWLLKAIAWVSLVIGPVLLLLLLQAQFLPYHREDATWIQRFAVLGDVVLLWLLWPAVLKGTSALQWPPLLAHPWLVLLSLFPIAITFFLATFPGGWLGDWNSDHRYIPPNPITAAMGAISHDNKVWVCTSLHHLLFAGEIDEVSRRRKSPFSNSLILTGFDALAAAKIDDEKKLGWAKQTVSLHGRNLQGAIFDLADLRKADLTNAILQRASFFRVRLEGASLDQAQLQGARLIGAQLQGASLDQAQLQVTLLVGAQLQGASLDHAQLQGAWLLGARLQGASLVGAQLQGAWLERAQLQGASLDHAQLQGASLDQAQLQGASLDQAQLQGASLDQAQLQGAVAREASVWRGDARAADAKIAGVVSPNTEKSFGCIEWTLKGDCNKTAQSFDELQQFLIDSVPAGERWDQGFEWVERDQALERIAKRLKPEAFPEEAPIAENWRTREQNSASPATILGVWETIGCRGSGAPYVARALLPRLNLPLFKNEAAAKAQLAAAFLAPTCAGAKGLTAEEITKLKQLAAPQDAAKGQTPAP